MISLAFSVAAVTIASHWISQLNRSPGLQLGHDLLETRAKNTLKEGSTMGLDQPTKYQHPCYWAGFTLTGQG